MSSTIPAHRKTLRTALLVIGSVAIVALVGFIVVSAVGAANRVDASRAVTIEQAFETLDITAEVTDVRVERAAVDATTLTFDQNGDRRNMTFDVDLVGSTLRVDVIDHGAGWWMPLDFSDTPRLTILVPESLDSMDVTMDSDIGDVVLDGEFADVTLVGTVGELRLSGSATRLDAERTAGDIVAPDFSVSDSLVTRSNAGDVTLALTSVPRSLEISSNVGDQDVTLPRDSYRVEASTNVGDLHVDVESDSNADTVLRFETTVGDITVRN